MRVLLWGPVTSRILPSQVVFLMANAETRPMSAQVTQLTDAIRPSGEENVEVFFTELKSYLYKNRN